MKLSALIVSAFVVAAGLNLSAAPVDPALDSLAKRMQELVSTKDEVGTIGMNIIETDGSSKTREMKYSRMNAEHSHHTMIRMLTPKDLKGTALLSILRETPASGAAPATSTEEKYVYLPSSKQTRKVTTSEGNARVLDSELYTEDFDLATVQTATSRMTSNAADKSSVIETMINEPKSPYGKTIAYVSADARLQKAEVYDKKGQLLKKIEFFDYHNVAPGKIRAGMIKIENLQNHRKTELKFSGFKVNQGLQEKDFTPSALAGGF